MANEPQYTKAEAAKAAKQATAEAKAALAHDADTVGNTRRLPPQEQAMAAVPLKTVSSEPAKPKSPTPTKAFMASMERTLGITESEPESLLPEGFGDKPAAKQKPAVITTANRGGLLIPAATPPEGYGLHPETIGHRNAGKQAAPVPAARGGALIPAANGLSPNETSMMHITNAIPGALFGEQREFNLQVEHRRLSPQLLDKAMEAAQVLVQQIQINPDLKKAFAKNMDFNLSGQTELKEAAAVVLALDEQRTFGSASYKDLSEQLRGANLTKLLARADELSEAIDDSLAQRPPDARLADRGNKSPKM